MILLMILLVLYLIQGSVFAAMYGSLKDEDEKLSKIEWLYGVLIALFWLPLIIVALIYAPIKRRFKKS